MEGPRLTWHLQKVKNRGYKRQGRWSFDGRGKLILGKPACDQDDRNHQNYYEAKKGDAKHECRGLQFFNLVRVGLEVYHFTAIRFRCLKAIPPSLIGSRGGKH